jgi:hypothetical protein
MNLKFVSWKFTNQQKEIIIIIIIISIIIIIIIIIIMSFMQGIYSYIPETNYVPREYSVAPILLLLFMVLISLVSVLNLLYFYISTFLKYVCSAQYGFFLEFLDFMLSFFL